MSSLPRVAVVYGAPLVFVSNDDRICTPHKEFSVQWGDAYFAKLSGDVSTAGIVSFRSEAADAHDPRTPVRYGDTVTVRFMTDSKSGPRFLDMGGFAVIRRDASEVKNEESRSHLFKVVPLRADPQSGQVEPFDEADFRKIRTGDMFALESVKEQRTHLAVRGEYLRPKPGSPDAACAFRVKVLSAGEIARLIAPEQDAADQDVPDAFYEFQRFYRTEWNTPRLGGDPPHFSDAEGRRDHGRVPVLDGLGRWVVDTTGNCDAEGWEYAHAFSDLVDSAEEARRAEEERRRELRALTAVTGDATLFTVSEGAEEDGEGDDDGEDGALAAASQKILRRSNLAQRGHAASGVANMVPLALRGGASTSALRAAVSGAVLESLARRRRWVLRGSAADNLRARLLDARRAAEEAAQRELQEGYLSDGGSGSGAASDGGGASDDEGEGGPAGGAEGGAGAGAGVGAGRGAGRGTRRSHRRSAMEVVASVRASGPKERVLRRIVQRACAADSGLGRPGDGGAAREFTYDELGRWLRQQGLVPAGDVAATQAAVTELVSQGRVLPIDSAAAHDPFASGDQGVPSLSSASAAGSVASAATFASGAGAGAGSRRRFAGPWRPRRDTRLYIPEAVAAGAAAGVWDTAASVASRSVFGAASAVDGAGFSPPGRPPAHMLASPAPGGPGAAVAASPDAALGFDPDRARGEAADPVQAARATRAEWGNVWIRTAALDPRAAHGVGATAGPHCMRATLAVRDGSVWVREEGTGAHPDADADADADAATLVRVPFDAILAVRSVWDVDVAVAAAAAEEPEPGAAAIGGAGSGAAGGAGAAAAGVAGAEEEEVPAEAPAGETKGEADAPAADGAAEGAAERKHASAADPRRRAADGPAGAGTWDPLREAGAAASASMLSAAHEAAWARLLEREEVPWRWIELTFDPSGEGVVARLRGTRRQAAPASGHEGAAETLWLAPFDFPRSRLFPRVRQVAESDDRIVVGGKPDDERSEADVVRQLLLDVQAQTRPAQRAFQLGEARRVARLQAEFVSARRDWNAGSAAQAQAEGAEGEARSILGDLAVRADRRLAEAEASLRRLEGGRLAAEYSARVRALVGEVAARRAAIVEAIEEGRRGLESTTETLRKLLREMQDVLELQLKLTALYSQPVFPKGEGTMSRDAIEGVKSAAGATGRAMLKLTGLDAALQTYETASKAEDAANKAQAAVSGAASGVTGAVASTFSGGGRKREGEGEGEGEGKGEGEGEGEGEGAAATKGEGAGGDVVLEMTPVGGGGSGGAQDGDEGTASPKGRRHGDGDAKLEVADEDSATQGAAAGGGSRGAEGGSSNGSGDGDSDEEVEVKLPEVREDREDHRPILRVLRVSMLFNLGLFAWVYLGF